MHKIIATIALLFIGVAAQAAPNYDYIDVKPGETYTNSSTQTQQIRVKKIDDKTKYEKVRDTMYQTTNAANDVVNNVRVFTSLFGLY